MRIYDGWLGVDRLSHDFPAEYSNIFSQRDLYSLHAVHNSAVMRAEDGLVTAESRILALGLELPAGASS